MIGPGVLLKHLGIDPEEARKTFLQATGYSIETDYLSRFSITRPRVLYRIETDESALDYAIDQLVERVYLQAREQARRELRAEQRATLKDITSRIIDEVIQ